MKIRRTQFLPSTFIKCVCAGHRVVNAISREASTGYYGLFKRDHFHLRGLRGSFMKKVGFEKDLERGRNLGSSSRDEVKKTVLFLEGKQHKQRTLKSVGPIGKIAHNLP